MKDIIVADFEIQITKIVTGVKNAFSQLTTFVANIGDELYLMLSENLQFTMPKLAITLPWPFNKEIVITETNELDCIKAVTNAPAVILL